MQGIEHRASLYARLSAVVLIHISSFRKRLSLQVSGPHLKFLFTTMLKIEFQANNFPVPTGYQCPSPSVSISSSTLYPICW